MSSGKRFKSISSTAIVSSTIYIVYLGVVDMVL